MASLQLHSVLQLLHLLAVASLAVTSVVASSITLPAGFPSSLPCFKERPSRRLHNITYYVHAVNNGTVLLFNATAATSFFGMTSGFNYNITKGQDPGSQKLGTIRGLQSFNTLDLSFVTLLVLNTVTYDDGVYNGTIAIHGQALTSLTTYELPVVGGTGDFRGAHGYVVVTNLQTSPPDRVFRHQVHFLR